MGKGIMAITFDASRNLQSLDRQPPKHTRVREYLIRELSEARLRPGESLPTEIQLAEFLRVARTTVRQALSQMERDGLIRRVQGSGTFVHEQARQLLKLGLDAFALVVPDARSGFYPSLLHGFESTAKSCHHQAFICNTENDIYRQGDTILQLLNKKVSGVAIVPATAPPTPAYQIHQLQDSGIATVFCHRPVEGVQAPLVTMAFDQIGRVAGERFLEFGHRRVALFVGSWTEKAPMYVSGLRDTMRNGGGDLPDEFIYRNSTTSLDTLQQEAEIAKALEAMLSRDDRPTAIMASFDAVAELIYLVLMRMGVRVPHDISLMGVGGMWRNGPILPRLTSVVVDETEIGRRAAVFLNEMATGQRPLRDDEVVTMPMSLTQGQTVGPAPDEVGALLTQ